MSAGRWSQAWLLALLLAAGACSGSVDADGRANNDPSRPSGNTPGSSGGGSSGPAGNGGSAPGVMVPPSPAPDGGFSPPMGSADAGASDPAPGAPAPCQVSIVPITPPRLLDLLAGPTARVRLQAQVSGPMAPAMPEWRWNVLLDQTTVVETVKVSDSGDVVEVPLRSPGTYLISVSAGAGCPTALVPAVARRPADRIVSYWARITPPRASGLPTQEAPIEVGGGNTPAKIISLTGGDRVTIEPKRAGTNPIRALRSFIRVSSPKSSVRFEGNNLVNAFQADLNPTLAYDVLIVPDGPEAPAIIRSKRPFELRGEPFMFDEGKAISGRVRVEAMAGATGAAVANARVFMRWGDLPSSIGTTTPDGLFELRAREGNFQVSVLPAADSGLAEARMPEGQIVNPSVDDTFQVTYAAARNAPVTLSVVNAEGQPVPGARVRLDADPASLGAVATFEVGGRQVPAQGAARAEAVTDAAGTIRFARLPLGQYRAVAAPPAGAIDAATTAATITVASGSAPTRITLLRPVRLTGRLLPESQWDGLQVLAIENDGPTPGQSLSASVADGGRFSLLVAPGRTYRLQIEPAQERQLPRLFLGPHTAGTADKHIGDLTLSRGVTFTGTVTMGAGRVPDAVVQIFCTGQPPDCVDPGSPQLDTARPLAETKTGSEGDFKVHLPDPASWDL